jgi:hypothetical protein
MQINGITTQIQHKDTHIRYVVYAVSLMLTVANKPFTLSVFMLNVLMLSVLVP